MNKAGIFDAGVREILRSPLLNTQICTLIHKTQSHRSQPCQWMNEWMNDWLQRFSIGQTGAEHDKRLYGAPGGDEKIALHQQILNAYLERKNETQEQCSRRPLIQDPS